ncbi:MAG TPA: YbfB/YjiJ family MFS transporter [Alphaproteobacteria bacterium]
MAGGVVALAISQGIGRFAYTPLLPAMQAAGGFGADVAGYLASANYAGYLVGAFLVALLPQRWTLLVLRLCLIASVATTAAMAATTLIWAWAVLRAAAGLVSAGVLILASDIVFRRLSRERREALKGLPFGGVGAGIAISGVVVAATLAPWGWAGGWAALGVVAALLTPICWIGLRVPPHVPAAPAAVPSPPRAALAPRFSVGLLLGAYFFEGLGYIVSGTFLVAIVAAMPALSNFAPYTWIVVGLAACVAPPLWGALASRAGLVGTLIAAHLVQAVGIAAPALSQSLPSVLFSAVTFGATISSISALTLSLGGLLAPERSARIIGLLTAVFGVGQILGPVVAGELAVRSGNFDAGLLLAAIAVAAGAALLVLGAVRAARRREAALA